MKFSYVIEHMEEDDESSKAIPPWVELEYAHMRILAGPDARVMFTSLSKTSCDFIDASFGSKTSTSTGTGTGLASFECHREGIMERMKAEGVSLDKVCLLDPKAETELAPEDGDGRFEWFLFGGILGDDPPRDRTSELRVRGFPSRRLGPVQMTTDTALGVTKLIVADGIPYEKIPFVDHPTIRFNAKESVEMPFRYIVEDGEPKLPPGMKQHLHEDMNRGFDF